MNILTTTLVANPLSIGPRHQPKLAERHLAPKYRSQGRTLTPGSQQTDGTIIHVLDLVVRGRQVCHRTRAFGVHGADLDRGGLRIAELPKRKARHLGRVQDEEILREFSATHDHGRG